MQTLYKADGTPINLLQDTDIVVIECNLSVSEVLRNDKLKNCELVICNFVHEDSWNLDVISFGNYSLNSYKDNFVGVNYNKTLGEVKYQSSSSGFTLNKIIGIKKQ